MLCFQGSPERLMTHLVEEHSSVDPTYVEDLLLTYRTFLKSPLDIANKLVTWFSDAKLRDRVSTINFWVLWHQSEPSCFKLRQMDISCHLQPLLAYICMYEQISSVYFFLFLFSIKWGEKYCFLNRLCLCGIYMCFFFNSNALGMRIYCFHCFSVCRHFCLSTHTFNFLAKNVIVYNYIFCLFLSITLTKKIFLPHGG